MNRRQVMIRSACVTVALTVATNLSAQTMDETSQKSFDTVMAFMGAMGKGDRDGMSALIADDMVWQNEGDPSLPWIGNWKGKEAILGFLGDFSQNIEVTLWENLDAFASGQTVAVFGKMKLLAVNSDKETGKFTFALRAKVRDDRVVLWNWFEDSFAVSNAYHDR